MYERPTKIYLTSGVGQGPYPLTAFDRALQSAHCANFNMVRISSILPANCHVAYGKEYKQDWPAGTIMPIIYARQDGHEGEIISAGISCAIPTDPGESGMFFEHEGKMPQDQMEKELIDMANMGMSDRGKSRYGIYVESQELLVTEKYGSVAVCAILYSQVTS